jgi:N-acetylmuramoyl-L-alanine amidase
MKRKILVVLALILASFQPQYGKIKVPGKPRVVVIDAGHGGQDSGAVGLISKEKNIVLSISLKVGTYIEQNLPNVKVIYTRKTDVFIPLIERAEIANKNSADLFVSIHANSNTNTKAFGTDTYVMGLHKTQSNLEVAQKENSVIVLEDNYKSSYQGFDPNSAESYIIFSLMQNTYLDQSLKLASNIQDQFREQAQRKDRGVKQAGFLVLWTTTMPSVLIETGFISNPDEEKFLNSEQGQEYIAASIYRAIKNYFADLDEKEQPQETQSALPPPVNSKTPPQPQPAINSLGNDISFKVQVTSASKSLGTNNPVFKHYGPVFEYLEGGAFKYTVGQFATLNEAKAYQEKVLADFPGAFVVAFKNNQKIAIQDAIKESNTP